MHRQETAWGFLSVISYPYCLILGHHHRVKVIDPLKSLQAETTDIDLASAVDDMLRQRLANPRRMFESMS